MGPSTLPRTPRPQGRRTTHVPATRVEHGEDNRAIQRRPRSRMCSGAERRGQRWSQTACLLAFSSEARAGGMTSGGIRCTVWFGTAGTLDAEPSRATEDSASVPPDRARARKRSEAPQMTAPTRRRRATELVLAHSAGRARAERSTTLRSEHRVPGATNMRCGPQASNPRCSPRSERVARAF